MKKEFNVVVDVEGLPVEIKSAFLSLLNSPFDRSKDSVFLQMAVYYRVTERGEIGWNPSWNEGYGRIPYKSEAISINEYFEKYHNFEEPTVTIEMSQSTYESLKDSLQDAKVI